MAGIKVQRVDIRLLGFNCHWYCIVWNIYLELGPELTLAEAEQ